MTDAIAFPDVGDAPQPIRTKAGGLLLVALSPLAAVAILVVIVSRVDDVRFWFMGAAFLLIGAVLGVHLGQQLRAPDALALMRRDARPPVVLLRAFAEDRQGTRARPHGVQEGGVQIVNPVIVSPREHAIGRLVRRVGPFVAVGRPGDRLAPLGAARMYLPAHRWKDTVDIAVRRAAAVVLQPADSPGMRWDTALAGRVVKRRRLLLLVPNPATRPLGYERVRQLVSEQLEIALPAPDVCPACDAFYFDDRHRPVPVLLDGKSTAVQPFIDYLLGVDHTEQTRT